MQAELEAQLAEVRSGGLVSAGTAERSTDGEDAASASITTLEGETMLDAETELWPEAGVSILTPMMILPPLTEMPKSVVPMAA